MGSIACQLGQRRGENKSPKCLASAVLSSILMGFESNQRSQNLSKRVLKTEYNFCEKGYNQMERLQAFHLYTL